MRTLPFPHILPLVLTATLLPGPVLAQFDETSVLAAARAGYGGGCFSLEVEGAALPDGAIQRFEVMVPPEEGAEPQPMVLWQALCQMGAYNRSYAFWVEDAYGGLIPLSFTVPVVEVVLERPEDPASPVSDVQLTGWSATTLLVNAVFDPATRTFTDESRARGLGDAFATGSWRLDLDQTVLLSFAVDATYDEQINPVGVYPAP